MAKTGTFLQIPTTDEGATPRLITPFRPLPVVAYGAAGAQVDASRYGQLVTGQRGDDILVRFEYNNSTEDVTTAETGTGVTANANAMASASTGTDVGLAAIESHRAVAYRPGHEVYAFFTSLYGAPEAGVTQRHGLFDADNGFFFGYDGTEFGVTVRNDGADNFIPQSTWNKDQCDGSKRSGINDTGFKLNQQALNQYKITYGWLGSAPATFWIYSGHERGWILVHVFDQSNTATEPTIQEPSQHLRMEVERTAGTGADITMRSSSWAAGTIEGIHTHAGHRVFAGTASSALVANVESHIATFRNKSTFQGKTNKVLIEAVYAGFATDGNKSVLINFYRDSTISGAVFNDVDTENSVTEYDVVGTLVSTGKYEMTIPLAKVDSISLNLGTGHIHLELLPGESMTITGFSTGASIVDLSFRWEEYFS